MAWPALIGWKHVQNSPWMFRLYDLPPGVVELATEAAFADGLTDAERIQALDPLPGFGAGKAFASVLLAAWDPATYGVFDKFVNETRPSLTRAACTCPWDRLPIYFEHLRQLASELTAVSGSPWTPRQVDMAMFILGGGK